MRRIIRKGVEIGKRMVGVTVFIIIWLTTYLFIFMPTVKDPAMACSLAIIIALICGYLLGFQYFEKILDKIFNKSPVMQDRSV